MNYKGIQIVASVKGEPIPSRCECGNGSKGDMMGNMGGCGSKGHEPDEECGSLNDVQPVCFENIGAVELCAACRDDDDKVCTVPCSYDCPQFDGRNPSGD